MRKLLPILAAAILFSGCAARVSNGSRTGTPIENALAYNASLADANRSLAETAISLGKSGTVPQTTVTNITSVNFTVADADKQITGILNAIANCQASSKAATSSQAALPAASAPTPCVGNAAQMQTLVERITANAATLAGPDLGIKDATTQASVKTSVATLGQMANLILSTLQTAHLLE